MLEEALEKIGLTRSEVRVYLALNRIGSTTVGSLIEQSGVASSKIYEILDRLMKKGLASYVIEGGARTYRPAEPENLLTYLEDQEKDINKQKQAITTLLPQLHAARNTQNMSTTTVYRGQKGLETAFIEALAQTQKGTTIHVIGVPDISKTSTIFFAKWNRLRAKKGVLMQIVFDRSAKGSMQTQKRNLPDAEVKYLPEHIVTPTAANIFSDRVLLNIVGEEPTVVVVYGEPVVQSFKAQFALQWEHLPAR